MAPSKLTLFLALSLVLVGTSHGCGSCGNTPSVPVPTPPIAVPPPAGPVPTPPIAVPPPAVPVPSPPIAVPPPAVPVPTPPTAGGGSGTCSINTLKLGACANVLNLLKLNLGVPASEQCCPLLSGLADLDAAVCLCTAIKANVLGIKLNVPVDLVLLLNQCGKTCPADFTCPS
ncbi:cortical cell-delineating protein [Aegilops tauschii subsp. strangulata]|uniref:Bifunctional inhibitor/plant lipid transfer protein/seed storage helical domain-containing protein n=1 Tax=Aegilops tauschii subsp. strangulata TaxID=200361 RepID=A0A453J9I8_AEGTS|nr:pEARLI1-like lipid transfer protein 2 [Aegilops tauschii subsp. strangulata]